MIQAILSGNSVFSLSSDAFSLNEKSRFGEKIQNKIEYSPVEALFLLRESRMKIFSANKLLSEEQFEKKIVKNDKRIEIKYAVFRDLRKKGYIVKTALKFGADFRVYDKGIKPGEEHARWISCAFKENESLNWRDFAAKIRIAHSTKKNLLLALVDEESSVSYYEASWLKP